MLKLASAAFACIILPATALSACRATPSSRFDEMRSVKTICEAARLPIGRRGIKVTISAEFISDRLERSLLKDESCSNVVVVPYDSPHIIKDKGYHAFADNLNANPLQVGLIKFHVTIFGTLLKMASGKYRFQVINYVTVEGIRKY